MVKRNFRSSAREQIAQVWCHKKHKKKRFDAALANDLAVIVELWMETAANTMAAATMYRELLVKCGNLIGIESRLSDDGSLQDEPLPMRIPEVVAELCRRVQRVPQPIPVNPIMIKEQ
jgi:hypothetical protein